MPVTDAYRPEPRLMTLGPEFADPVTPAVFPAQILRFRNDRAAATVGLDGLTDNEWLAAFARFEPLPDNQPQPLAMRYHGHQFRHYNPDLGDGRGFLYAQLRETAGGRLLDLGTKGSGRTPWSRSADGRLTLKGGVREVMATEMLEALGVPTSRTFSLVETGESLQRHDEPSPTRGAVMTRLSHGHIRFGSFQRHAFHSRPDLIRALMDHVIEAYYPHLDAVEADARPATLLAAVAENAARMTAAWMTAGFVHGVLNTDNMNMTGESFDYGPYRFLPYSDPNFTAAYFDENGLYSFGRQAEAVFWNLAQLAGVFTLFAEEAPLRKALDGFAPAYHGSLGKGMAMRLGVKSRGTEADAALASAAFRALQDGAAALRWEPFFFDWFCGSASEARALKGARAGLYASEAFLDFRGLLHGYEPDRPHRLTHPYFEQAEPEELLYDQIEALWAPIAAADDWGPFQAKLERIAAARQGWGFAVTALSVSHS